MEDVKREENRLSKSFTLYRHIAINNAQLGLQNDATSLSGVPGDESIRVVRLSCDRGSVVWRQPVGAIHVRIDIGDSEVRQVCLRLLPEHSHFVSIRLVEKNNLTPLALHHDEVRCIGKNKLDNTVSIFLQSTNPEPWKAAHIAGFNYEVTAKKRSKRVFEGNIVDIFANDSNEKRHVIINKFIRRPMLYAEILHKETNGRLTALIDGCFSSEDERLFIAQTHLDGVHVLCSLSTEEFKRFADENEDNAPCQLI
uniref:WH1 domain-containing protein n=1 Tax=Ascaris lumbricoides TaxID=6252 RepID=A0A0M3IFI4_ASCLU